MKKGCSFFIFIVLCLSSVNFSFAKDYDFKSSWTGKVRDGKIITEHDLHDILEKHKLWLKTKGKQGKRADLQGKNLSGADLRDLDISEANLAGVNLNRANLQNAKLSGTDLNSADMSNAYLENAELQDANLTNATLDTSNLTNTNLSNADLRKAKLNRVDLSLAKKLNQAHLRGAIMNFCNLSKIDLSKADLRDSKLVGAKLIGTNLQGALLNKVDFKGAKLNEAVLKKADLREAKLCETDLGHADLSFSNMGKTFFEPKNVKGMQFLGAKGLETLEFDKLQPIVELRKIAKECSLRKEGRKLTSAIYQHHLSSSEPESSFFETLLGYLEYIFVIIFFGLTTNFGAEPWRPIIVLLGIFIVCLIRYSFAANKPSDDKKQNVILKIWTEIGKNNDIREEVYYRKDNLSFWRAYWRAISIGFQFSLLSTFRIRLGPIKAAKWISLIQYHEYELSATGWVRRIAGFQSIISAYLIVMWALTYFTYLFE